MANTKFKEKIVSSLCGLDIQNSTALVCRINTEGLQYEFKTINIWPDRPEVHGIYGLNVDGKHLSVSGDAMVYPSVSMGLSDGTKIVILAKIRNSEYYVTYTTPVSGANKLTLLNGREVTKLFCCGFVVVNACVGEYGLFGLGDNLPKVGHSTSVTEYFKRFRGYEQVAGIVEAGMIDNRTAIQMERAAAERVKQRLSNRMG